MSLAEARECVSKILDDLLEKVIGSEDNTAGKGVETNREEAENNETTEEAIKETEETDGNNGQPEGESNAAEETEGQSIILSLQGDMTNLSEPGIEMATMIDVETEEEESDEEIRRKQKEYAEKRVFFITDIFLPFFDTISDSWFVYDLFSRGEVVFAAATLGLLYMPVLVLLLYYVEKHARNARHPTRKILEAGCLLVLGPMSDSISAIVVLYKRGQNGDQLQPYEKFALAAKHTNGIVESSFQLIWNLFLIAIQINPQPWESFTELEDPTGNKLPVPVSTISLIVSTCSVAKNLYQLWSRNYYNQSSGSESKIVSYTRTLLMFVRIFCLELFRVFTYALLLTYLNFLGTPPIILSLIHI